MTSTIHGKLKDQTALITGGTSGIGLAAAQLFYQEGARVIATGKSTDSVERAARALPPAVRVVASDATSGSALRELMEGVAGDLGKIDVLFLNAGVLPIGGLGDMTESAFDATIELHLRAPWLALQTALPHLRQGARVVLNTSIANRRGVPGLGAYGAAKAGLRSLVRTAAAELAPAGIRVNAVSPGPTMTPIFEKLGLPPDQAVQLAESSVPKIPLGRLGRPEEIARAVLFLACDDSSFVVGTELVIDGGMSAV
jgi:NAD(P)-dependent dehydrogenase (short-subunit alcohol dehydrogenase family)